MAEKPSHSLLRDHPVVLPEELLPITWTSFQSYTLFANKAQDSLIGLTSGAIERILNIFTRGILSKFCPPALRQSCLEMSELCCIIDYVVKDYGFFGVQLCHEDSVQRPFLKGPTGSEFLFLISACLLLRLSPEAGSLNIKSPQSCHLSSRN